MVVLEHFGKNIVKKPLGVNMFNVETLTEAYNINPKPLQILSTLKRTLITSKIVS